MTATDSIPECELYELALKKVSAVLGPGRARRLIDTLRSQLGIELSTPQELYLLSEAMLGLGGFEAAVGAMLGVIAIMRGANPSAKMVSGPK